MDDAGAARLYALLDILTFLKREFASDIADNPGLSAIGPGKVADILDMLDRAIFRMKEVIGNVARPVKK